MTTGTDILMGTNEISTYHDGINLSTIDVIFGTTNTAFRVADSLTTPSVLLSIDKTSGTTVKTGSFTNNAPSIFNEKVTGVHTKTLFVDDIQYASGDAIDITAGIVAINGSLTDNYDARLKYDVDLLNSVCFSMMEEFKRKKRDDKDAIHIGYTAMIY